MAGKKWTSILVPVIVMGVALSSGTTFAQGLGIRHSAKSSMMPASGNAKSLPIGDELIGAAASPPKGMGNGLLIQEQVRMPMKKMNVSLDKGANAFQIAIDGNTAYIPTLQGITYVVNLQSHKVISKFSSPKGTRIANISLAKQLLILTGAKSVTAYSLHSLKLVWHLNAGGNTLSIVGNTAYLSGNATKVTRMIDLKSGKIIKTIPVGMIEDSVYDPQQHTLWLANWTNGDMTIVNTKNNQVVKVIRKKEGGGFSMSDMGNMGKMMMAQGGFMELAVGPHGGNVYAASFSGNIMDYNALNNTFVKDIPTLAGAKLSGIAIDPSGQYAYTTVESKMETVAVSLKTDKVVSTYAKVESNRWFVMK